MDIKKISQNESFGGVLLILAVILALIVNNSPLSWAYTTFLNIPVSLDIGGFGIHKPLLLWINDGLMAVFFLIVGLEVKKEVVQGELSSIKKSALPIIAAIGGIIIPALIYKYFNHADPYAMRGWAIPAATDIAFAVGILALLGKINPSLRILLLSIAIIDDIAAILIIAFFYTDYLSLFSLSISGVALLGAFALNRRGVKSIAPYMLIGLVIWTALLKSGIHATLAGVMLAMAIPIEGKKKGKEHSPLLKLEHELYPWVYFAIMPIFAFANSGIDLFNFSMDDLLSPVALGIICGLFFGKQIGVMGFIWLGEKLGLASRPSNARWIDIYGIALLTGIGFTMSLFIGALAFDDPVVNVQKRISVLIGSFLSAGLGYFVLKYFTVPFEKQLAANAKRARTRKKNAKNKAKKKR